MPGRADERCAGRRALVEALRHVGVTETPPGSNRTPFGRWFGVDGVPWCAIFVSYCFKVGAGIVLCGGANGAGVAKRGVAYVPTLARWLRTTGQWVEGEPQPGDIAIFDWDGGEPDHAGIVERGLGVAARSRASRATRARPGRGRGRRMRRRRRSRR